MRPHVTLCDAPCDDRAGTSDGRRLIAAVRGAAELLMYDGSSGGRCGSLPLDASGGARAVLPHPNMACLTLIWQPATRRFGRCARCLCGVALPNIPPRDPDVQRASLSLRASLRAHRPLSVWRPFAHPLSLLHSPSPSPGATPLPQATPSQPSRSALTWYAPP
eukprot:1822202-Prymnesium_polylepis.2